MKHIYKPIVAICLCIPSSFVRAQTVFSSVQDVWKYAEKHNSEVQTAEANRQVTAIGIKQAYGAMLPQASVDGSFTDNMKRQATLIPANLFNPTAPAGKYTEVTFGKTYNYAGAFTAQLDIVNMQDWFNIKAARLRDKMASLDIAKTKMTLYTQLANAYYSSILLEEAEKLSKENLETTRAMYELSNNKYKEGLVSEITVNTALINKEKAEKSLDIATQNRQVQLNNLKLLLNIRDSIVIAEKLEKGAATPASPAFADNPDVALAYSQMLFSKNAWRSSKASFAPVLSGVYQYSTQVSGDNFFNFSNSNTTPMQYWGLRLSMPLFSGNIRRYQVQADKIDFDNRKKQYENTKLQSSLEDQNALLTYNSALKAFEKSKEIMELYKSNDGHAERKMKEGVISLDDRLKAFSDLLDSQNDYLQSMSDYFIQEYNLQIRQTNFIQ